MTVASRRTLREVEAEGAEHFGSVSTAHGFMPWRTPSLQLPSSHSAWDQAAAELPNLWRDLNARSVLRELPLLSAEPDVLPDSDLWRASIVLSALAYSYARCDLEGLHAQPPVPVPGCIDVPWTRVAERMGRPGPHIAYDDLITQNYRLIDADAEDPIRLENLHLLVPLLGNETERAFFGVNIEVQARLTPVVESAVRAQEAVVARDREALVESLLVILAAVRDASDIAFPKIDPNPHARIVADPVVWAKLSAPTGISIVAGAPGVSGAASTGFQLVDALLGRTRFDSPLGEEAQRARRWFAPNCRRFLDAIDELSIRRFIADAGDRQLSGLFQSVLDAYAGDRGYLGVHRRKVYGFIEVAFKVGRPSTASGITGRLIDKTWLETDEHLGEARDERYPGLGGHTEGARLAHRKPTAGDSVQRITFDVAETGLVFRAGDRCAVLPEQTDALVRRTVESLRSPGDRPVPLMNAWRAALRGRFAAEQPRMLPLSQFLRYADLRPLDRRVAKRIARLSGSEHLHRIVERREEDRLELWEAFELAAEANYDVSRLTRAELWQDEAISRIVPPVSARMYSISATPDRTPFATELQLTVGHLDFSSLDPWGRPAERRGTASTFLAQAAPPGAAVNLQVVRPLRFTLPVERDRPIVMFAGGTGIAPFHAFIQARVAEPGSGATILFAAARTRDDLPYFEELTRLAEAGHIVLHTAFSQESVGGVAPRRIDAAIADPATSRMLRGLLLDRASGDGSDAGPLLYVCGRAAFAASVLDAIRQVMADGTDDGRSAVRRLVGEGRLMTDLFTTFAPRSAPGVAGSGTFDASELVVRNDDEHGWWVAINGAVYDMTEFRQLHPGGFRIIDECAGTDATTEYEAVGHHKDSEIEAMLAMYKIGFLRRLDLGQSWGVALHGGRARYVPLVDLFKAWTRHLYRVVELENSHRNDMSVLEPPLTSTDTGRELTPLKVMFATDLQSRMLDLYLPAMIGDGLSELWALACGLLDPDAEAGELPGRLQELVNVGPGAWAHAGVDALRASVSSGTPVAAPVASLISELTSANVKVIAATKALLREGLIVFERYEGRAIERGASDLMSSLRAIPDAVATYYERVGAALETHLSEWNQQGGDSNGRAVAALRRTGAVGSRPR